MKKKTLAFLLCLTLAGGLGGCGDKYADEPENLSEVLAENTGGNGEAADENETNETNETEKAEETADPDKAPEQGKPPETDENGEPIEPEKKPLSESDFGVDTHAGIFYPKAAPGFIGGPEYRVLSREYEDYSEVEAFICELVPLKFSPGDVGEMYLSFDLGMNNGGDVKLKTLNLFMQAPSEEPVALSGGNANAYYFDLPTKLGDYVYYAKIEWDDGFKETIFFKLKIF